MYDQTDFISDANYVGIDVEIKSKKTRFMIDTGATINLITKNAFNTLGVRSCLIILALTWSSRGYNESTAIGAFSRVLSIALPPLWWSHHPINLFIYFTFCTTGLDGVAEDVATIGVGGVGKIANRKTRVSQLASPNNWELLHKITSCVTSASRTLLKD